VAEKKATRCVTGFFNFASDCVVVSPSCESMVPMLYAEALV
jgi:hypothetical protein